MALPLLAALLPGAALEAAPDTPRRPADGRRRVLVVADHLGYDEGVRHGVTTYLQTVLPELKAHGLDVGALFLRRRHGAADRLESAGIRSRFLELPPRAWSALPRLHRALGVLRPDVVLVTQMQSTFLMRMLRPWHPGIGLVMQVHDMDPVPALMRAVGPYIPQPDSALCVSEPARRTASEEYGVKPDRVRVLHNALDPQHFRRGTFEQIESFRAELALPAGALLIGRVARMHKDKRNDVLIRMLPQLLAAVPQAVAVFAGDGPERPACEALARELGVEHAVRFLGQRDDVAVVTEACDVLAVTTREEPFGFTAIEAMAVGRPVVGFADGGLPEVVDHGRTGFLAASDDLTQFAGFLVRLLKDAPLRREMGRNAGAAVTRFSLPPHVETLATHLRRAADSSRITSTT